MLTELEEFKKKSVVVSPIGGSGSRLIPFEVASVIEEKFGKETLEEIYAPKPLLKLGGKRLIDIFIEEYKKAGLNRFAFLVGKGAEAIEDYLGDGSKFKIEIRYSRDPNVPKVGKGKALKNAYLNKTLEKDEPILWGFPDDIIWYKYWIHESIMRFLHFRNKLGTYALIVLVPWVRSPYGMAVTDGEGRIVEFKEKPKIEIPTSTGRAIMDSEKVRPYIDRYVDINHPEAVEIEDSVFPVLAREGKLAYMELPSGDDWSPINTLKEFKKVEEGLYQRANFYAGVAKSGQRA